MVEEERNPSEYISLQEATKYCNYSQEYLSLRARQGRLRAIKFGRNWMTKKEWLNEYLEKVKEWNNNNLKAKKIAPIFTEAMAGKPPENLPIADYESGARSLKSPVPLVRFGFLLVLIFVLLIAGITFGEDYFKNVFEIANPYLIKISQVGDLASREVFEDTKNFYVAAAIGYQDIFKLATDIFKEYSRWLAYQTFGAGEKAIQSYTVANNFLEQKLAGLITNLKIGASELTRNINQWFNSQTKEIVQNYIVVNDLFEKKISQGWKAITGLFGRPEKTVEEKLIPKPGEEGMILIPSTEKDEEVKEKIKDAFSDEVKVEPKDKISGFITPIFKEGEGQKYLYMLVPVKSE
jgi:excisionase family DNA binding protein